MADMSSAACLNLSNDIQEVLVRLINLEKLLMQQSHYQLPERIAQQVVQQLKGEVTVASLPSGPKPVEPNTKDVLRSTEAILLEMDSSHIVRDTDSILLEMDSSYMSPIGKDMPTNATSATTTPFKTDDIANSKKEEEDDMLTTGTTTMALISVEEVEHQHEDHQEASHKEKVDRLRIAIQFAEAIDSQTVSSSKSVSQMIIEADVQKKDNALDLVVAAIIILNAVVIGISMDYKHVMWDIMDVFFTLSFLCELGLKFKLRGVKKHFSSVSNCFDFGLIVIDLLQLLLDKILQTDAMEKLPAASMFRVLRLLRLTRLIRLARLHVFDELVAMITGLVGGMTTLMWSIVFFGLIVYITSLLFREFYGNTEFEYEGEDIKYYFASVPRAMYTTFRYFFGDFSTSTGISLFEAVQDKYGAVSGVFVALLFFMITIGLFNVIAAIFVESTLEAAYATQNARKTERMNDELLWGRRISILTKKFFEHSGCEVTEPLSECLDQLSEHPCTDQMFATFIKDPMVIKALTDLEITDEDHKYLFDILDNDNTGDILISQLSDGVERLRGDPRRSDIICVDLMVRSIQAQANYLCSTTRTKIEYLSSIKKSLRRIEACLGVNMGKKSASTSINDESPFTPRSDKNIALSLVTGQ